MDIIPLVNNLEMLRIFKNEDKKEGDGITDSLSMMLRLQGEELKAASWLIKAWSKIEPIELYNEKW